MPRANDPNPVYDRIVDSLVRWAIDDSDVKALWVEGDVAREVRRPYVTLRVHVATDEPAFASLLENLPKIAERLDVSSTVQRIADVPRSAKELRLEAGDTQSTLVAERTSMLPKRPRAFVATLLDRTGHLTEVMDLRPRAPRAET